MHGVDTHAVTKLIEKGVTGLEYRLLQVCVSVATTDGGTQGIVSPTVGDTGQAKVAGILNCVFIVHKFMLQTSQAQKRLHRRTRRIGLVVRSNSGVLT